MISHEALGYPRSPSASQVAQLEHASLLVDEPATLTAKGDGCIAFEATMPTTGTMVLDFQYRLHGMSVASGILARLRFIC